MGSPSLVWSSLLLLRFCVFSLWLLGIFGSTLFKSRFSVPVDIVLGIHSFWSGYFCFTSGLLVFDVGAYACDFLGLMLLCTGFLSGVYCLWNVLVTLVTLWVLW